MLNPSNDREDYGEMLAPPGGYRLDFAVGTTYSLDLDALIGATLALGLSEEMDSILMNNPVCLLEALRSTGDKVALFCESGQIHLPGNVNYLYILLEKMVFSVKTRKNRGDRRYASFHPKFWLIRYINDRKEKSYRVIVLSRNLTFDRSWDLTCYMDGMPEEKETDKNEPICDFLRYLLAQLPENENGRSKAGGIRELIRELSRVRFEWKGREFQDYQFIPNGIKRATGGYYRFDETPLFKETFHEILIISPFLTGSVIRHFNDRNQHALIRDGSYMLITRDMALKRLSPEDASRFRIYTMKDYVIDGESGLSEGDEPWQRQDIHAKAYMIRKHSEADLYVGSLNATESAVFQNVEFMIRLRSNGRYLTLNKLTHDLFGDDPNGPENPFHESQLPDKKAEVENDGKQMEEVVKEICRNQLEASVYQEADQTYRLEVFLGETNTRGYEAQIYPMLYKKPVPVEATVHFRGLAMLQLSDFYVIEIRNDQLSMERVVIIPTEGLPEDREKTVVSNVVNNRESFYRYIIFLLGDESILSFLETQKGQERKWRPNRRSGMFPALYEKMLKAAADAPEKFEGIEYLMKTIEGDVIPEDFKGLYETFAKVVKKK